MKIRDGFVSNSSTTSFTCQVCGDTEAYSDSCSLSDVGACECAEGHIFCECHAVDENPDPTEDVEDELDEDSDEDEDEDDWGRVSKSRCPICMGKNMDLTLVEPFLLKKLGWTKKQIWAEMQKLGNYEAQCKAILEK